MTLDAAPSGGGGAVSSETFEEVLRFDGVSFGFPGHDRPAIVDVDFRVARRKFVAVIGPSGCGKSTLLNLAAGLIAPTRGTVAFAGRPISKVNTRAAYVTQSANLLPWLSVQANIGLALKIRGVPADARRERVAEWVERVGLSGFERHNPRELSGGMQKRCAIARALVYDPSIVLMDEPFGPLDAITRLTLQQELLDIWEAQHGTLLFVTHDLNEAICLADEVVVMSKGPGTVRGILPVPIERPRDIGAILESAEYGELYRHLWELFRSELEDEPGGRA
jgi:sulfonate transport system ATP-binding protein